MKAKVISAAVKKVQQQSEASMGFKPLTLAILLQKFYHLSYEATKSKVNSEFYLHL